MIKKDIEGKSGIELTVSDILGNIKLSKNYGAMTGNFEEGLDLNNFLPGIYILNFKVDERSWVKKIIVE